MSLSEFASGAVFGGALYASGVWSPSVIKSQLTFSSNTMVTVMMGASATSALVFEAADRLGIVPKKPTAASELGFFPYDGNILGGAAIGIGMAVTGACPGTTLVQGGVGMLSGIFVILGGLGGALVALRLQPALKRVQAKLASTQRPSRQLSPASKEKPLDIATALNLRPVVLLLIWVPLCVTVMGLIIATDRTLSKTSALVSPAYGGLLIGFAQLVATFFTGHSIGASAAFDNVAQWMDKKFLRRSSEDHTTSRILTPSVMFSIGIVCSAALSRLVLQRNATVMTQSTAIDAIDFKAAIRAMAGGCVMILGSRLACGCTSGHGISGLAKFSISSLITTAAMFSAGILTAKATQY